MILKYSFLDFVASRRAEVRDFRLRTKIEGLSP